MKTRPVIWAPSAQRDLLGIVEYLVDHNSMGAERIALRIQAAAASLGDAATGRPGRVARTFEKIVRGLPYIIAYEIVTASPPVEQVMILRIIHGARDWTNENWPID